MYGLIDFISTFPDRTVNRATANTLPTTAQRDGPGATHGATQGATHGATQKREATFLLVYSIRGSTEGRDPPAPSPEGDRCPIGPSTVQRRRGRARQTSEPPKAPGDPTKRRPLDQVRKLVA